VKSAQKLKVFNFWATLVWLVLCVPSVLWWKNSVMWVILISLWANVIGHFTAYIAARSEEAQQKGHNLTKADRDWISAHLALALAKPDEL
jgi:hypothetical protein